MLQRRQVMLEAMLEATLEATLEAALERFAFSECCNVGKRPDA